MENKMGDKVEWKKIGTVHTDSGRLMITDPAAIADELWTDDDYGKFVLRDDSLFVQVPFEKAVLAYVYKDGLVFNVWAKFVNHGTDDDESEIEELRVVVGDYSKFVESDDEDIIEDGLSDLYESDDEA